MRRPSAMLHDCMIAALLASSCSCRAPPLHAAKPLFAQHRITRSALVMAAADPGEARRLQGERANLAALRKLMAAGEAATLEEAQQVNTDRARAALYQKKLDRGEAETMGEARSLLAAQGSRARAQKLVDRGEAATVEEAWRLLGAQQWSVALQNLVDSGEAATLKEASVRMGAKGAAAVAQRLVDSGEAATLKDARRVHAVRLHDGRRRKLAEGGETWEKLIRGAQKTGEKARTRPRVHPCPLGCGYMFTTKAHARRHAESPTACPTKVQRLQGG